MRHIDISKFSTREGAKKSAVENFLSSLSGDQLADNMNVHQDARSYGWNAATVRAIKDGIREAYS